MRSKAAVEVLLDRFQREQNPHIYLAAARALLAYNDADVRARWLALAPAKLEQSKDWGKDALTQLLNEQSHR